MEYYSHSERCCECEKRVTRKKCFNCHFHVCDKNTCSIEFPHYDMTYINICASCCNEISEKFKLVINYSELTLLKKKIKSNTLKKVNTNN